MYVRAVLVYLISGGFVTEMERERMHPVISWLSAADDGILKKMAEYPDLALGPKGWYENMKHEHDVSHGHVQRRLRMLSDAGLVRKDPARNDFYQITDEGISYVRGELSQETLENMNPNPEPKPDEEKDEDED